MKRFKLYNIFNWIQNTTNHDLHLKVLLSHLFSLFSALKTFNFNGSMYTKRPNNDNESKRNIGLNLKNRVIHVLRHTICRVVLKFASFPFLQGTIVRYDCMMVICVIILLVVSDIPNLFFKFSCSWCFMCVQKL